MLLRKPYRALLNGKRGYAAFDEQAVASLLSGFEQRAPILDPMAGYGSLLDACSKKGISSVSIEINVPLYLWQLIRNPTLAPTFVRRIDHLLGQRKIWPKSRQRVDVSGEWFVDEAKSLLSGLLSLASSIMTFEQLPEGINSLALAAALLVPFCGRLACCTESANNPTWVKQGGMVIFQDWQTDFEIYLNSLKAYIQEVSAQSLPGVSHRIILGDCSQVSPDGVRFRSMLTSPPYPNRTDYYAMFAPEIAFCAASGIPEIRPVASTSIIGSNVVKNTNHHDSDLPIVREFLDYVRNNSASKPNSAYDNRMYYLPYYANYFQGLTEAYHNVSRLLDSDFLGYIIVQNNYFRDKEIPLSDIVSQIWEQQGFRAQTENMQEVFHVGTKNPRARGRKAKQTLYTLRISR